MTEFYTELTSRNWAFISPEEQQRIRGTRVLFAGCGLSSVIATLAVQTGFSDFTLVDFDDVEVSNLNRQAFDRTHIGRNKALALADLLMERSEVVSVRAVEGAVTPENAPQLVAGSDIVVNTVDFDETTFALNAAAREAGIPSIFPMNMGWGGFALVFTPESATLEDLVGDGPVASDAEFLGRLMGSLRDFELPGYLAARLHELPEIVSASDLPAPQLGIAAVRSASLVVEAMAHISLGQPVRTAPRPMHFDTWEVSMG